MANPFTRSQVGQPLNIPAAAWNQMLEVVQGGDYEGSGNGAPLNRQTGIVKVRNDSGADAERFGVLGIHKPIFDTTESLPEFQREVMFCGVTPVVSDPAELTDHAGRFVILLEPIPIGQIGRAVVAGVAVCRLAVADPSDRQKFADVADGETTLQDAASGAAQILWAEDNGQEEQWAVVRIAGGGGESAPAASSGGGDIHSYTQVGSSPFECYYPAGTPSTGAGPGSDAMGDNALIAIPLIRPVARYADKLALFQVSAAGSGRKVRMAIYGATSATNLYPDELIAEAAEHTLSNSSGNSWRDAAFSSPVELAADRLYWLVLNYNLSLAANCLYCFDWPTQVHSIFGWVKQGSGSAAAITNIKEPYTYGAMPSTFPSYNGATTVLNINVVTLLPFVHYST